MIKTCNYCLRLYFVNTKDDIIIHDISKNNICYECFNVIDEEINEYGCRYCNNIFNSEYNLQQHIKTIHPINIFIDKSVYRHRILHSLLLDHLNSTDINSKKLLHYTLNEEKVILNEEKINKIATYTNTTSTNIHSTNNNTTNIHSTNNNTTNIHSTNNNTTNIHSINNNTTGINRNNNRKPIKVSQKILDLQIKLKMISPSPRSPRYQLSRYESLRSRSCRSKSTGAMK